MQTVRDVLAIEVRRPHRNAGRPRYVQHGKTAVVAVHGDAAALEVVVVLVEMLFRMLVDEAEALVAPRVGRAVEVTPAAVPVRSPAAGWGPIGGLAA